MIKERNWTKVQYILCLSNPPLKADLEIQPLIHIYNQKHFKIVFIDDLNIHYFIPLLVSKASIDGS